ncbi:MAG TPA: hypothetical protein PKD55_21210, partial [Bellilinea sp.]|nr:hypothetical protein [Bellilinea sp.]
MLHPTQLPDCAIFLNRILDFQEHLLELGCDRASLTPDDLRDALGEEAFKWLQSTRDTRKLFEPIYAFSRLPQEEKDVILADFRHDRQYTDHLEDASFQFHLLGDVDDQNRQRIKVWLINFYEQFAKSAGIDGTLLRHTSAVGKIEWWQAYHTKNGGRLTCSVCDGSMNHGMTAEHYLPKSKYPALAIHPHNLL